MNSILNQIKQWRSRWKPQTEESADDELNRAVASCLSGVHGERVRDHLIETYMTALEFIGPYDALALAERNGQQKLVVNLLKRYDIGMHPMMYQSASSSDDGKEMDVRQ